MKDDWTIPESLLPSLLLPSLLLPSLLLELLLPPLLLVVLPGLLLRRGSAGRAAVLVPFG
jgi:hypothetical protein